MKTQALQAKQPDARWCSQHCSHPRLLILATMLQCVVFTVASTDCHSAEAQQNVNRENKWIIVTSVFGGISLIVCFCVVAVIIAHKKDQFYLRERIILGLMAANILYSGANLVPTRFITDVCKNEFVVPIGYQDVSRGMWFWGKYWMVRAIRISHFCIFEMSMYTSMQGPNV